MLIDLWVIISMMVLCDATVVTECDRRTLRLPGAPLDMKYGNNITEEYQTKQTNQSSDILAILHFQHIIMD